MNALRMGGARLECAIDRVLPVARRRADDRVDDLPPHQRRANAARRAEGRLMDIVLVAAVAENGIIGRSGGLPWRLKSDLQQFRALTTGKPIVMSRRT